MNDDDFCAPELEAAFVAQVGRGSFSSVDEAREAFFSKLDASIAQIESGDAEEIKVVAARMMDRYAHWPRAAE